MSLDLDKAFYDRMVANAPLMALIGSYTVSGTAYKCIFTSDDIPETAPFPLIHTSGQVSDAPFDTKTTTGRDVVKDIHVYTEDTGSSKLVNEIAEAVRALFHRQTITVTGYGVFIAQCAGPVMGEAEGAYSRIVSVRLVAHKTT